MQFNKLLKLATLFIISTSYCAYASNYPKTREEQISEEMGSIVGGEGIVFRPGHVRKDETKAAIASDKKVNKFLWDATREVLGFMPTASLDRHNGILITDWYSTKAQPNYNFKIEVSITDDVISPESVEVKVFERKFKNGQWINEPVSSALSIEFEDKILRKARELHIRSKEVSKTK